MHPYSCSASKPMLGRLTRAATVGGCVNMERPEFWCVPVGLRRLEHVSLSPFG